MLDSATISQYLYLLSSLAFLGIGILFYTRTQHHGCILIIVGSLLSVMTDISYSFYDFLENKSLLIINFVDLISYTGAIGLLLVSLGLFLVLSAYTQQQK